MLHVGFPDLGPYLDNSHDQLLFPDAPLIDDLQRRLKAMRVQPRRDPTCHHSQRCRRYPEDCYMTPSPPAVHVTRLPIRA